MGALASALRGPALALATLLALACEAGPAARGGTGSPEAAAPGRPGEAAPASATPRPSAPAQAGPTAQASPRPVPQPSVEQRAARSLLAAHLALELDGDQARARGLLTGLLASPAPARLRARAALRLAEEEELSGDGRAALAHLEQARALVGPGHLLALEADERRTRVLAADPLADIRGPAPGEVQLSSEPPRVAAAFRLAEARLRACHRVLVAPRLEEVSEILRRKRRALGRALRAYRAVAAAGGVEARAAALFRQGALHHHMAEALAFELPTELLPSAADRLRRQLSADSAAYLKKSLASYRAVAGLPASTAAAAWRGLAAREASKLEQLF